jgi:epoxyqueuosine reductase QueG
MIKSVPESAELDNKEKLVKIAADHGADLVGVADLQKLKGILTFPPALLSNWKCGVSIAVSLDKYGLYEDSTEDVYAFPLLTRIATRVCEFIEQEGFKSHAIAADERIEERPPLRWKGEISHKSVAKAAGLGWIGKSLLLITPEFGPRVCLTTVLTDMPLATGFPMTNACGKCTSCILACPARALQDKTFKDHPESAEEVLDFDSCDTHVENRPEGVDLCFECMLACPKGRRVTTSQESCV